MMAAGELEPDELDALRNLRPVVPVTPPAVAIGSTSTSPAAGSIGATIQYKLASAVSIEPPEWLWEGWIVYKAFQLVAGRQGAGKTTWASHIAACATTGNPFPGQTQRHEPIKVAFLSHEDPESRVASRLEAAGADRDLVFILGLVEEHKDDGTVQRQWMMPRDIGALEALVKEHGIELVIIDGVGYSIASDGEPGYTAVSQALSELGKMAERSRCAVWGLTHPSKGSNDPVTAAIGSTAWTAQSRIFSVLGVDKDDPLRRVVRVSKSNYKEPETGYVFEIADHAATEAGYVVNVEPSDIDAFEIMASVQGETDQGQRTDAKEFLRGELAGGIERPAIELFKLADQFGISKATLKRAKKDLGVKARKAGMDLGWVWSLDEAAADGFVQTDLEMLATEGAHGVPLDRVRGDFASSEILRPDQGFLASEGEEDHEGAHVKEGETLRGDEPLRSTDLALNSADDQGLIDLGVVES